jgi:hypothetical protein
MIDGYIDGWIIDQQSPDESLTVKIFVDDSEIATTVARLERPHLKKKFSISSSAHGFRVLVPNKFRDGTPHAVSLAVADSGFRRGAREELQISAGDEAPYLEIVAISEGSLSGRLYGAEDRDIGAPELWIGGSLLSADDVTLEWGPSDTAARTFKFVLRNRSAESLLAQSAQVSVAHGKESGHGLPLKHFVAPQVARLSTDQISVGASIPFPVLDQSRCRLELSKNETFSAGASSFMVDLSLGQNDIVLPAALREGEIWARLVLLGASSPVELLAPTLVPGSSAVAGPLSAPGAVGTEFGLVYVFRPAEEAALPGTSGSIDASVQLSAAETDTPDGRLSIATDDDGSLPFLRLVTSETDDDTQLRFVFPAPGLQAGDLLHLRWFGRASASTPSNEHGKQLALSFAIDGAESEEAWAEGLHVRPKWHDHHAILRMPAAVPEVAIVFTAPAGCLLDIGGLAVGKITNAADALSQASGGGAAVALGGVVTLPIAQPLPPIVLSDYRRFGVVAHVGSDGISGIAWSRENIKRTTQLQLLVDGQVAGFVSAEPLGNFENGVSPGFFSATLPSAALDAQPHEIDVQFMGSRESLMGVPWTLAVNSRHDGVAWLTPEGDIAGWAADPSEDAGPIEVEVRADGRSLGRVIADAQHPMFSDAAHNNGRCAFSFHLPEALRDDQLHTITVRTSAGVELSGSPILAKLKRGRSTLHIDPTLSGWIKGWVTAAATPAAASLVEITVNGEFFGTIRADRAYDGAPGKAARFRFSFRLPRHAAKVRLSSPELGVETELDVVYDGDTSTLRPSTAIAPPAEGLSSGGMAALLAAPEQHVDADWYFAMYPVAGMEAADRGLQSAVEHWINVGAKRGWSPNPWFDERWYLARNPDAAAAVEAGEIEAGYLHWLAIGAAEWRSPGPVFNPIEYRREHPLAEGYAIGETAFDVVREWLAKLASCERDGNFGAEEQGVVVPPEPGRSVFRRAVTSRLDRTTMFDTHVGRLLEDLRVGAYPDLEALRRAFDDNEVEIIRSVMNYEGLDEPLVSIIMPTFNRAYVIAEGIQSVLDQNWQNWELIVCDDGSFDKTPKIVRQFADPRIRYLQLEKSNGAIARNFGIKFARGEYIAFLDSDNIWHPLYLTLAINNLRSSLRPAVYTGYIDTSSDAVRYTEAAVKFAPFDYLALIARNYIDLNSLVVQRDLFDKLGSFDETLPRVQDWDLVLRLLRFFDPVEVRCAVVFYRRNPSWGQVTDLAAHTDYTKVVRQRALDRLRGHALIEASTPDQAVSLYAGATPETLEISLAFARLLCSVTDVLLLLPDAPAQRSAVAQFKLQGRARLAWLRGKDRLSDHLTGGTLFVPEQCGRSELQGIPESLAIAEFSRVGERVVIKDRRLASDPGVALGALRLDVEDEAEEVGELNVAPLESRNSVVVLTIAPMRQRWARALARRGDKLQATLLWYEGSQIQAIRFNNGQTKAEALSFRDALECVRRHAAMLLTAGTGEEWLRSTSLGIEAQRSGVVLVVGKDDLYETWVTSKCAHLAPDDPETASDLLAKVLDDHAGGLRMKTRARRLFDYLYRSDATKTRLSIAISLL